MNIIEKIIQKIKNFLFRTNQKKLTDGSEPKTNKRETFLSRIKHSKTSERNNRVKNKHLEHSLGQFFEQLSYLNKKDVTNLDAPLFYRALVGINAIEGNPSSNSLYQENLSDAIRKSTDYTINFTPSYDVSPFYHVKTKEYSSHDASDMVRLYINCKNENVAKLVHQLLYHNNDSQFYLKACSSDYMETNRRSEKIVIYSTKNQFDSHIKLIDSIKQLNPTLFEGSEKTNPFMPTYHGIAYSPQPISSKYKLLNGKEIEIGQSSNSFIARTIQESYIETVKELAATDPKLSFLLEPENINDEIAYTSVCEYVNSKYHVHLINSMETRMAQLCTTNNLEINGIHNNNELGKKPSDVTR